MVVQAESCSIVECNTVIFGKLNITVEKVL